MLRTDVVRDELLTRTNVEAAFGEGRYSLEHRELVYHELLRRAAVQLDGGISVILDGSYFRARDRAEALECGCRRGADILIVECICSPAIARERIELRRQENKDASEARADLVERQKQNWEPLADSSAAVKIDTTKPIESQLEILLKHLPRFHTDQ